MNAPKTLLQMAGADLTPCAISGSAIVIIDAQREYVDGKLPLTGVAPALDKIAKLLTRARAAGALVIHIAHQGKAGGAFDPAGPGGAIADEAAAAKGEAIISKTLPNAFAGTDLQKALEEKGAKQLILAGFMTHMCVSSTARAALDLGYRTTVVSDAAATRDLPGPSGGVIKADALHMAALAALADRFAIVAPLERIPE
ncbi:MAG: cysteine hydrolase family protein [Pseudomonadota bacterium]|nr:cysteine hydrolase family protein [Pseudomonadota bacterium]